MKRYPILLVLMILPWIAKGQILTSAKEFLANKGSNKSLFKLAGVFSQTIDQDELVFSLRDTTGEVLIKLDDSPEKAIEFYSYGIVPGDTVLVMGKRRRITTDEIKSMIGMYPADILSHSDGPNHDILAADRNPSFRGRGIKYFSSWVSKNLRYPSDSKNARSQGVVKISFVINEDGSISDVKTTTTSGDPLLDAEAIRVVSSSPRWFPALANSHPVKKTITIPVYFVL